MATALSTLRSDTYDILNELQTSNVYDTDFVDQIINEQHVEVCAKKKWQFLRDKKLFDAANDTTLTTAITTASTSVVLGSTTNMESSGAVWMDHDVIDYTAISTLTLTGVTGIGKSHAAGIKVYPLFAIPTDYERMPVLMKKNSGAERFFQLTYVDEMNWDNVDLSNDIIRNKFTVVNSETDGALYLRIETVAAGDDLVFYYLKKPTTLSSDTDESTIPDPYARKIIPKLAAAKLMILRNDDLEGLGTKIQQVANTELLRMEKYYGQREESWSKLIKPTYRSQIRVNSNSTRVRI